MDPSNAMSVTLPSSTISRMNAAFAATKQTPEPAPVPMTIFDFAHQTGAQLFEKDALLPKLRLPNDSTIAPLAYDLLEFNRDGGTLGSEVYEPYRSQRFRFPGSQPHPTPLVEAGTLASIAPPPTTYRPTMPKHVVESGILSDAQLEAITLAGQAHTHHYEITEESPQGGVRESTVRGGFMVGDGTGVGKSRTLAAIIMSNWLEGRHKAIWITENASLLKETTDAWVALGGTESDIFLHNDFAIDEPIVRASGILFTTYATLRSQSPRTKASRCHQIINWLNDCPDAVIVCDESQNASNAIDAGVGFMNRKASLQGRRLLELQAELPDARVVYASATAMTKLDALAYAPRLGLWGNGRPFPTRSAFIESMGEAGTAGLEAICLDLKALGLYVSRSLSLDGVTYERLVHELTPEQIKLMQSFNTSWQMIQNSTYRAMVENNIITHNDPGKAREDLNGDAAWYTRSKLEDAKLRFYMLVLISLKMPTVIAHMRERLAAGECCVVQLYNTHEAAQERAFGTIEKDHELTDGDELPLDLDLSPRSVLIQFVQQHFPIHLYRRVLTKSKRVASLLEQDDHGTPIINPEMVALRDTLISDIEKLVVPEGPLEILDRAFGTEIAELTGRKRRAVWRTNAKGDTVRVMEVRKPDENDQAPAAFMNDEKRILVFSEVTGGIGRNFHADPNVRNQRRRNHYMLQMSFRTDKAYQGMGRTNRANQVVPPHYVLCTTDVPGEMRFASNLAKGCATMGALCRGQREACNTGLFASKDNLETVYGSQGLRDLLKDIYYRRCPIDMYDFFVQTGIDPKAVTVESKNRQSYGGVPSVGRFLNRLLAVELAKGGGLQGLIWSEFTKRVNERIEQAIAEDRYDAGIETIKPLHLVKLHSEVIHAEAETGAKTYLVTLRREDPLWARPFGEMRKRLKEALAQYPDKIASFMLDKDGTVSLHVPSTNGEKTLVYTPFNAYLRKNSDGSTPITPQQASVAWRREIKNAPDTVQRTFYVVAGSLLPIWRHLPTHIPKVYRMQTDDGERLLGRVVPATLVPELRKKLAKAQAA
jgi:hypothetical protein